MLRKRHWRLTLSLIIAAAVGMTIHSASAQQYPEREVRVIVPFSAGGGTDLVTRIFAQALGDKLGRRFFIENVAAGAGGSVGSRQLSEAEANGYTIGTGTSSGIVNLAMDQSGFNPLTELEPIARYGATTLVLAADPKLPLNSFSEFVAYAKQNPDLTYGSSGVGSTTHLAFEMLASAIDVRLTHVPYRGEGAGIVDLMSGQIQLMLLSLPAARQYVQSGALKALAVTSVERFPALPNVPTLVESGLKDFVVDAWYGLYVPKGTPATVTELLVKSVNDIRADPDISKRLLDKLSFDTSGSDDPAAFKAYMEKELERYSAAAKTTTAQK